MAPVHVANFDDMPHPRCVLGSLFKNPYMMIAADQFPLNLQEPGSRVRFKQPHLAGAFQVLMPGETAAPNTPSGKTGTPSSQQAGTPFNVRVNACDAYWNVIPSSDTVTITSSDTGAGLPANAALVGGTKTFAVTLNTAGSATVTASDVTDNTKTANTGSSTTVTP